MFLNIEHQDILWVVLSTNMEMSLDNLRSSWTMDSRLYFLDES